MTAAVIFDMDGLLIDSEPFWSQAEIEVFATLGLQLTEPMTKQTMGLRIDEVVAYWHGKHPWSSPSREVVAERVVARVIDLVCERGEPKPGVQHALELAASAGVKVGLASSSQEDIIQAVLKRLSIDSHFDVVQSAQAEPYGKPHPGVYLTAAEQLGVAPTDCVALEDSPTGVLAAKAARMRCIAVPDESVLGDKRFAIADIVLASLVELTPDMLR